MAYVWPDKKCGAWFCARWQGARSVCWTHLCQRVTSLGDSSLTCKNNSVVEIKIRGVLHWHLCMLLRRSLFVAYGEHLWVWKIIVFVYVCPRWVLGKESEKWKKKHGDSQRWRDTTYQAMSEPLSVVCGMMRWRRAGSNHGFTSNTNTTIQFDKTLEHRRLCWPWERKSLSVRVGIQRVG